MAKTGKLTEREQRFVEAFAASGNATHSARVAGYAGDDHALGVAGSKLLTKPRVSSAIAELSRQRTRANIVTREERLQILSSIARGEKLGVIGVSGGKPVIGTPSHDAMRKAAMDIARMNGELLPTEPTPIDVRVQAQVQSLHVVVMLPQSSLGPPPPNAQVASTLPALEAGKEGEGRG